MRIHPEDATALGVNEGDWLRLLSRRGEMEAQARVSDSVTPRTCFLPIHFGENPTNILTNAGAFDPLAKIPEFKVGAVRIEKITG